ncbi:hypothetical protein R6Q57_006514 [Mikania cordata]
MDETSLREKRPYEDVVGTDLGNKRARTGGESRSVVCLKKVAEIVLVLAAMGTMRGGRKPTAVEVKMMAEARSKSGQICKEFAPKDVFPTDAFGTVIEDLGLDRLRETKLGILPTKMSIAQKLQFRKEKMEKSEVFPLHSTTYTTRVTEPCATPHAVQTVLSSKGDHTPNSCRSFQNNSSMVHASMNSNSRNLPYQLPASEVRPVGSNVLTSSNLGRGYMASSPIEGSGRLHLRSDGRSNANSLRDQKASHTPTWSIQSQPISFNKAGLNNGSAHLTNTDHHMQNNMNFVQHPATTTHNEIAKIVQKILQPLMPDHHTWNPPSRDYMNKALACQTCKRYHLRCLQCNSKSIFGDECREWHCTRCLEISNGKPLPFRYGRVMKNINTSKRPASSVGVQPSSETNGQSSDENFNQRLMSANSDSASQTSTDMQISVPHECGTKKFSEKCQSNVQILGSHQNAATCSNPSTQNGIKFESNQKGENRVKEELVEGDNVVKTRESYTTVRDNEVPSPSSMHDVEWVGSAINEIDGKMYYRSCCISGTTYKLQDYALFSSIGNNLMPNKLQSMWEDNKTNKKWVSVTCCFFPDALPKGVGRPCAPESNEVYESNHETTLAVGLIHGPCEVLPPRKFEDRVIQIHSQTENLDKPKRFFLSKWFYDEKKDLFRDIVC